MLCTRSFLPSTHSFMEQELTAGRNGYSGKCESEPLVNRASPIASTVWGDVRSRAQLLRHCEYGSGLVCVGATARATRLAVTMPVAVRPPHDVLQPPDRWACRSSCSDPRFTSLR